MPETNTKIPESQHRPKRPLEAHILLGLAVIMLVFTPVVIQSSLTSEYGSASSEALAQAVVPAFAIGAVVNLLLSIFIWRGQRWALITYTVILGLLLPTALFLLIVYAPVVVLTILLWARSSKYFR